MGIRNAEVIEHWERGRPAKSHTGALTTDGYKLYSYSLLIGDTCNATGETKKILRDYTSPGFWPYHSQTTSCHVGLARLAADIIG